MATQFQSVTVQNAPMGLVQETGSLITTAGQSIGIALFSYLDLTIDAGGWSPAGWAGLGSNTGCVGFDNVLGSQSVQAGPITGTNANYTNWSSILLLFAASSNLGLIGDQTIASGAFGTASHAIEFDVPQGSTLIVVVQGTALGFPTTPVVASIADSAGNTYSPLVNSNVINGSGYSATVVAAVAFNTPFMASGSCTVTVNCSTGGNNSVAHVLVLSGIVPTGAGFVQGSMLM